MVRLQPADLRASLPLTSSSSFPFSAQEHILPHVQTSVTEWSSCCCCRGYVLSRLPWQQPVASLSWMQQPSALR